MRQVTEKRFAHLVAIQSLPCISLYQSTHRQHPANVEDPIRFRNSLKELKSQLSGAYDSERVRAILKPFEQLAGDAGFWNRRGDGLAIFASLDGFELFEFSRPVQDRLIVADSFHTKPLVRILQSADRFQVLSLSRHEATLYEGNRDGLESLDTPTLVSSIEDVWVDRRSSSTQEVGSYGKQAGVGGTAVHHGHEPKSNAGDTDVLRFFRAVDQSVLELHSRPSKLPLVLVALPDSQADFRRISSNPCLLKASITQDPKSLDHEELRLAAWNAIQPSYLERLAEFVERFGTARSREQGSGDLSDIAKAVVANQVETLLVDADRVVPGTLDRNTGAIEFNGEAGSHVDDLLDDLAEMVMAKGGEVVVVPSDRMPTTTGLAAIFRF